MKVVHVLALPAIAAVLSACGHKSERSTADSRPTEDDLPLLTDRVVGNGGDPIETAFEAHRIPLSTSIRQLTAPAFASTVPSELVDAIIASKDVLAHEVAGSRHVWTDTEQESCGATEPEPLADIRFSRRLCVERAGSAGDIRAVLVHEAAHHLGITDENRVNAIAAAIAGARPLFIYTGNHGYNCEDAVTGQVTYDRGPNLNFLGDCGNVKNRDFHGAELSGLVIRIADLTRTRFDGAQLSRADFSGSWLGGTNFIGANLSDAVFAHTNGSADFTDADLTGADIAIYSKGGGFAMRRAKAVNARGGISSKDCDCRDADFSGARLVRSEWYDADLRSTVFRDASLRFSRFQGADLRGVDFTGADLDRAEYDAVTRLPFSEEEAAERGMIKKTIF